MLGRLDREHPAVDRLILRRAGADIRDRAGIAERIVDLSDNPGVRQSQGWMFMRKLLVGAPVVLVSMAHRK